jgi:hypothetical protein
MWVFLACIVLVGLLSLLESRNKVMQGAYEGQNVRRVIAQHGKEIIGVAPVTLDVPLWPIRAGIEIGWADGQSSLVDAGYPVSYLLHLQLAKNEASVTYQKNLRR